MAFHASFEQEQCPAVVQEPFFEQAQCLVLGTRACVVFEPAQRLAFEPEHCPAFEQEQRLAFEQKQCLSTVTRATCSF